LLKLGSVRSGILAVCVGAWLWGTQTARPSAPPNFFETGNEAFHEVLLVLVMAVALACWRVPLTRHE
jgi:hypothetical protein